LTYAFLVKEFGERAWIPSLTMVCLAAGTVLLMTLVAGRVMRGPAVVLPGLLLVGFALPVAMDATHHWFSTVAVLAASLILLGGSTWPRIAAVGILCGIAACYTQNKGVLAVLGFIAYLAWKKHHEVVLGVTAGVSVWLWSACGRRLRRCECILYQSLRSAPMVVLHDRVSSPLLPHCLSQ
jgi:hypothetical protein